MALPHSWYAAVQNGVSAAWANSRKRGIGIDRDSPSDCLRLPKYGLTPLRVRGCKLFSDEL